MGAVSITAGLSEITLPPAVWVLRLSGVKDGRKRGVIDYVSEN
jgi:hypothetical protein